uniref:Uncharacterized protein n=1 Tax=Anguilla anguilla TaxID=7936 RepID=A0A0E9TZR1_ANGAN
MATKFIATVMGSRLQVLVSQEPVHHIHCRTHPALVADGLFNMRAPSWMNEYICSSAVVKDRVLTLPSQWNLQS